MDRWAVVLSMGPKQHGVSRRGFTFSECDMKCSDTGCTEGAVLYLDFNSGEKSYSQLSPPKVMAKCPVDLNGAGIEDNRATLEDEPDLEEDVSAHGRGVGLDDH
ncbi:hypothetical protein WISP_56105 [Willisornis vidua]|uniref:Uncharacterized protein n=1 Tax=Willisornis vidua TaxID=1566151 RepID=A0ABQ9DH31_9PASS|nr:hypothetical protein WISP_56105 [Willisornis vidua]